MKLTSKREGKGEGREAERNSLAHLLRIHSQQLVGTAVAFDMEGGVVLVLLGYTDFTDIHHLLQIYEPACKYTIIIIIVIMDHYMLSCNLKHV